MPANVISTINVIKTIANVAIPFVNIKTKEYFSK